MEIYVGNLAYATTDDGLKAAFAQFGEVTAVRVVTDRMTGRSKGFGFVTMPDATQAQAAIDALNGHELGDSASSRCPTPPRRRPRSTPSTDTNSTDARSASMSRSPSLAKSVVAASAVDAVAMAADAAATVIVAAMAIVALVARLAGNRWFVDSIQTGSAAHSPRFLFIRLKG